MFFMYTFLKMPIPYTTCSLIFRVFFCQKTIMTSHHKIITRGRQSDDLSFKGSLVAERKVEPELGILMLTLLPSENAFVDFTHIIRYIQSLYFIIEILTVVLHNYTKYHWNKTNLLKMFYIRIAVKKKIKIFYIQDLFSFTVQKFCKWFHKADFIIAVS